MESANIASTTALRNNRGLNGVPFLGRFANRLDEIAFYIRCAKNKARPFVVWAAGTQVRAVGTSFTVSLLPQKPVEVLVREDIVNLKRTDAPHAPAVRATANVCVVVLPNAPMATVAMPQEKLARDLEWQYGRIAPDNETLADVAGEFARYSKVRIVVDPAISDKTLTGLFAPNDPVGFAKTVASVLKLQTQVHGNEVRIFAEWG
jgi:transmembrane sensor